MTARLTFAAMAIALLSASAPDTGNGADALAAADPAHAGTSAATPGELRLKLDGLRSSKGTVRVCIWTDPAGFPDCSKNPHVIHQEVQAAPVVEIDLASLPPGDYGVSAIHDENDNRKLDRSFIGLPTEGVAFSNNAPIRFGPPRFDKVRFTVNGTVTQTIHMRYFL